MIIESSKFRIKLEDFQLEDSFPLLSSETEKKAFWLVNKWINGENTFSFHTSGSTGKPKNILIDRQSIIDSTHQTFDFIDKGKNFRNCLLCLDPGFIGGAMVVFRALIMDLDLFIVDPTRDIFSKLPPTYTADLVSMAPLQYNCLKSTDKNRFNTILVGGAPVEQEPKNNSNSRIFSTYGMTETVSHIALRRIDEPQYQVIGDIEVDTDSESCLKIKGNVTKQQWINTNDIVELISDKEFKWLGRKDYIINSGGVKLNPEVIERKLSNQIAPIRFMVSSLPDERLGEKVVLLVEEKLNISANFDLLDKYEKPKMIIEGHPFVLTDSGKVDRIKTRNSLKEIHNEN